MGFEKKAASTGKVSFLTENFLKIVSLGDSQLINLILLLEVNFKVKDDHNRNALFHYIDSNNDDESIIENLTKSGVPIDEIEKVEGHNAITFAAKRKLWNIVKVLASLGANVNHRAEYNGSLKMKKDTLLCTMLFSIKGRMLF